MDVPNILNASGFSFAPADARKGTNAYDGINPALVAVGAALEGIQKPLQEHLAKQDNNAFLQGQADHMAGIVREQSWLTRDAYDQGVKFGKFGESQLQFAAKAKALAQESTAAGDDVQTFTQKLAPLLKEQSDFMDGLGLEADARDKANASILNNVNVAQKLYQSELEATTIRNVNTATNSITAGAVNTISSSGDNPAAVAGTLGGLFDSVYALHQKIDPKGATATASAQVYAAINEQLTRLPSNTPAALQATQTLQAFMNTDQAMKLDGTVRGKILDALDNKTNEFQKYQSFELNNQILNLQDGIAKGTSTVDDADAMIVQVTNGVRNGAIDPATGTSLVSDIWQTRMKADKEYGKRDAILHGDYKVWAREGYGKDEVRERTTAYIDAAGGDTTMAGVALITAGRQSGLISDTREGIRLITDGVKGIITTPLKMGDEIPASQASALQAYVQLWQQSNNNQGLRDELIRAMPSEYSAALMYTLDTTTPLDASQPKVFKNNLDTARERLANSTLVHVKVDPDYFDASFNPWSKHATRAEVGSEPSSENWLTGNGEGFTGAGSAFKQYAQDMQAVYNRDGAYLFMKGYTITDTRTLEAAMLQEGLVTRTPSGPVFFNRKFRDQLNNAFSEVMGKPITASGINSSDMLGKVVDRFRQEIMDASHGNIKKLGDIHVSSSETGLTFQTYDTIGLPMKVIDAHDIAKKYREIQQEQGAGTPVLSTMRVGNPVSGTNLNITADWGAAMGSNTLGVKLAKQLRVFEGWAGHKGTVPAANEGEAPNTKRVYGLGILDIHKDWAQKMEATQGDPTKMAEVQGQFVRWYFDTQVPIKDYYAKAGLAMPDSENKAPDSAYVALADTAWHGGSGSASQYAEALKLAKTDINAAMVKLQDIPAYKRSQTSRKGLLRSGLLSVYAGDRITLFTVPRE